MSFELPENPSNETPLNRSTEKELVMVMMDSLMKDKAKERRHKLYRLIAIGFLIFMYFAGIAAFWSIKGTASVQSAEPFAAVIKIEGPIGPGEVEADTLYSLIRQAFEHPKSKGIILQINSPGGTPVQSALINEYIQALKKKHNKPVIAVAEDMMASGAYMIAVSADRIYANQTSIVGSIGVISGGFGFDKLIEKYGVDRRIYTSGKSKSQNDPFKPVNEQDVARTQVILSDIHQDFIERVKQGRGGRINADDETLFDGSYWVGTKAKELGLVDGIGNVISVAELEFETSKVQVFAKQRSLFEDLVGQGIGLAAENIAKSVIQAQSTEAPAKLEFQK